MKTSILLAVVALSSGAFAQTSLAEVGRRDGVWNSGHSSVLTGRTVGAGNFVVHPEIGYPGVSVGLIWGQDNFFDAGLRVSAGYGSRSGFDFAPGVGVQAVLRWNFLNAGIFSMGGRFEPGVLLGAYDRGNVVLLAPLSLDLGLHPHPIFNLALGFDLGLGASFAYSGGVAFLLPLQAGPGAEINLTDWLALTVSTRFGAGWSTWPDYNRFGFRGTVGLAFKT